MAAVLSARALLGLDVRRHLIQAVSAGDQLIVKLENQTTQPKTLLKSKTCPLSWVNQCNRNYSTASELPGSITTPLNVGVSTVGRRYS